jgi:hypothetical protein
VARYAVRFSGDMTKDAMAALRSARMGLQRTDSFFADKVPYSTTVVVQADDTADAVARVRAALEGHGDFAGFEGTAFGAPRVEDD